MLSWMTGWFYLCLSGERAVLAGQVKFACVPAVLMTTPMHLYGAYMQHIAPSIHVDVARYCAYLLQARVHITYLLVKFIVESWSNVESLKRTKIEQYKDGWEENIKAAWAAFIVSLARATRTLIWSRCYPQCVAAHFVVALLVHLGSAYLRSVPSGSCS